MQENSLYLGLLIATLAQSSLLIGALLTVKNSNKEANYILSIIIGLFSYYMLIKILCGMELIRDYPHFTRTYRLIPFLVWVAFYYYIKAMTNPNFRFQRKDMIHLIPFVLYFLISLPYFFSDQTTKLQAISAPTPTHLRVAVILQTALLFIYLLISAKVLKNHKEKIKDIFSNLENIKLNWLRHLLLTFGITWGLAFINGFFLKQQVVEFVVPPIVLCVIIYTIGFYALKQPVIFNVSFEDRRPATTIIEPALAPPPLVTQPTKNGQTQKYERSGLSPKKLLEYRKKLITYLESEKPYTNNDLKLNDIADYLELPSHHLSQIINTGLNRNFYDLINSYRIEEAKRELTDLAKQHVSILAIAYEVGFNSKSAFNNAFKKHTLMTPSQYKKIQLNS